PVETGNLWPWYLGSSLLAIIMAVIVYAIFRVIKNRKQPLPVSPLTATEQLLSDLKKAKQAIPLTHAGTFVLLLSTGIRRYIEREFSHQAKTQTTEEFLQSFQRIECIHWDTQSLLCDVLRFSDQVKFAGRELQEAERCTLYRKAGLLALTLCRLRRRQKREAQMASTAGPNSENLSTSITHD
ncbi:MAG: hypothetical protein LBG98_01380, partial [Puniceicoccales bacterium]|nr:hypothetical protein [Puniceicoccales bacterium]